MRKYCLNCGKKFYPAKWVGYPQQEYTFDVPAEHRHFHSLSCMKEWLAKNHEAFSLLLTNVGNSDNASETNNHN